MDAPKPYGAMMKSGPVQRITSSDAGIYALSAKRIQERKRQQMKAIWPLLMAPNQQQHFVLDLDATSICKKEFQEKYIRCSAEFEIAIDVTE